MPFFQFRSRRPADARYRPRGGPRHLGCINLLDGYVQDNPASKILGMKQLIMMSCGVALIGITLVLLLSGLFG